MHTESRSGLARFIDPRTVAVVGASLAPGSFGARTLANLAGFTGEVFAVNPRYSELGGRTCYPSLTALPLVPDCVVVAVPSGAVEMVVREAAQLNAGGVIVYASSYSETGRAEGAAAQRRLAAIAAESGMPMLGPNCVGFIHAGSRLNATFAAVPDYAVPTSPAVGIVSQSGAMGIALMQAAERGMKFSHMLTAGNSAGLDVADLMEQLIADPACGAIACQFEGLADPLKLLKLGRLARAAGKPVVIHKLARGASGARAALSHTGSLSGTPEFYDALFEKAGFVTVENYEALLETAAFFAKAGRTDCFGVGMLSGSGGATILATDCAEAHGVDFPAFEPAAKAFLESLMPAFGSASNPCDLTAEVLKQPGALVHCTEALLQSSNLGLVLISRSVASSDAERMRSISALAQAHRKTVCLVWLTEWLEGPGSREAESSDSIAIFRSMDRCMEAIVKLRDWTRARQAVDAWTPVSTQDAARSVEATLSAAEGPTLTEAAAKEVLAQYGIPVAREAAVATAAEVRDAAAGLRFPVVLKIDSPDIAHKTDVGGVRLDLKNAGEVEAAFDSMLAEVGAAAPRARIRGALIQEMVPPGVEILVGGRNDPMFGPMITVGLGGVFVELLRDTVVAMCPVSPREAERLLDRLKGRAVLDGFRGSAPVHRALLAQAISRASEFLFAQQARVAEFEINPLICSNDRVTAVDGLILLRTPAGARVEPEELAS